MFDKKYLKPAAIAAAAALVIILLILLGKSSAKDDSVRLVIDGEEVPLSEQPVLTETCAFIPVRDAASAIGAGTDWDNASETVTVTLGAAETKFTIGSDIMTKLGHPIKMPAAACYGKTGALVPAEAFAEAFGYTESLDGEKPSVILCQAENTSINPLNGVTATDAYRCSDFLGNFGSVNVFSNGSENLGMESIALDDSSGAYADAVSSIALSVPEADVYSVVVPSAQEFYASSDKRTDQTSGIASLYDSLLSRRLSNLYLVNAVGTLSDHADEKIYFSTDHHWTQRGAYYAYSEFSKTNKNIDDISPLTEFQTENKYGYKGSLCGFTAGTEGAELLEQNPDMLQLFYPKPEYVGAAYSDPFMNSYISNVLAIYPWLSNYSCFLQGDYPMEVFKTNVNNGRKICIIKESFGDAFAVWALNSYEEVYVVDYRMWNGGTYGEFDSNNISFKIRDFYDFVKFDDLVIISYPVTVSVTAQAALLAAMAT